MILALAVVEKNTSSATENLPEKTMPVNLVAPDGQSLFPVAGLRIGIAQAGVRKAGRACHADGSHP